jgi:hypothetical protein
MKQESENATGASASVREVERGSSRISLPPMSYLIGRPNRVRTDAGEPLTFRPILLRMVKGNQRNQPDCSAGRVGGTGRTR